MTRRTVVAALGASAALAAGCAKRSRPVTAGAKNSTEQRILAEIIGQLLESRLSIRVNRRFGFDGTRSIHAALISHEIDLYVEYTGTQVSVILGETPDPDPAIVLGRVQRSADLNRTVEWLRPLGIDNPYAVVIAGALARENKLQSIEDAASSPRAWVLSMTREFQERRDGYPALMRTYGIKLRAVPLVSEPGRIYSPLQQGAADMAIGRVTDGVLDSADLVLLKDNKSAFSSNMACITVLSSALQRNPNLRPVLEELSGKFTNERMRSMDAEVDVKHRDPRDVAADFMRAAHLV